MPEGTTVTLTVTVPATAIGVAADGDVPLTATVTDGVLTGVTYTTAVGVQAGDGRRRRSARRPTHRR